MFAALMLLNALFLIAAGVQQRRVSPDQPPGQRATVLDFPEGTATPSENCGVCHQAIYREFAEGFGGDLQYKRVVYGSSPGRVLTSPGTVSSTATLHAAAGTDPFPLHARDAEEEGRACNVCHFPEPFDIPDIDSLEIAKPKPRPGNHTEGLTCASCHLTPDGKIRGPYAVSAPHQTVAEPKMRTSAMCAYCHAMGKRVVGKQTQTFLEWRDDFAKPGLGGQQCVDCHMPRTMRRAVDDPYSPDVPVRAVARHLWTGGHSAQRLRSALSLVVVQREEGQAALEFHVINIGAGHSVPTGSNRRAVYLKVEALNAARRVVAAKDWMFAPSYGNRPDDRAFLEADKSRPDAVAAMQADAQGPHESIIRAGEERILTWMPSLRRGTYQVRARLVYDLNRYNDKRLTGDQTEMYRTSLSLVLKGR